MRIEIYYGMQRKSELVIQGDPKHIDINKICETFLKDTEGYRLEIYRN